MTNDPERLDPYRSPQPDLEERQPATVDPTLRLLVLFGSLYFVQGIIEPTAGLPSQPLTTQLRHWRLDEGQIGHFLGIIGIAWSIKPLFGLLSDFVPIFGRRRFPYLAISTALAAAAFLTLATFWDTPAEVRTGLYWFIAAGVGIAMTDVVVDALAVERGQPLGLTGQFQSVQWGALSVATIIGGTLGGYVAQHSLLRQALAGCGLLGIFSFVVVMLAVREPPRTSRPQIALQDAWRQLRSGRQVAVLLAAAMFLFLWNFNPFASNVLQHYMTEELHLGEQFFGNMTSLQGVAQVAACIAYYFYCRRVPFGWLVHLSIITGILSTAVYWGMYDRWSAAAAAIGFGFTYQTATLVQLDLAARVCPSESAGTLFALLMAISNTGITAGVYLGGDWYESLTASFAGNRHLAFDALVAIGAAFTAGCWLLVPVMRRAGVPWR